MPTARRPTDLPVTSPTRFHRWRLAAVFALFAVFTAVMLNAMVRDPAHLAIGLPGDNYYGMRQLWWMKHALVDLHRSPYFDPESYYPVGATTARAELFPATSILAIPLTMAVGPVVAYNGAMFLTFVLMGAGTYLWVRHLTGSDAGGIVAGAIAAFLPYRMAHALGHLDIISTHWIPWALFAFERFMAEPTRRRAALLGVLVGLVGLSAWYYAYAIAILLPIYVLARARPWRERPDARWWTGLALAAAIATVMLVPFAIPYARLRMEGSLARGLGTMEHWSLNFYAFILPNRLHPWMSAFSIRWFPQDAVEWVERGVALGYVALGLAVIGFAARRRNAAIAAVVAVWIASYLIALGPTLHSGDRRIQLPVPLPLAVLVSKALGGPAHNPMAAEVMENHTVPVVLPSAFMYYFVPLTSGMRVMARFGLWTGLMTAALAGWGVRELLARLRARGARGSAAAVALTAILVALVLTESYATFPVTTVKARAVDSWLRAEPSGGWAVIELPLEQTNQFAQDYYKTVHQRPTVFSSPTDGFRSDLFVRREEALRGFPSRTSLDMLRECRVRYVLFTPAAIPGWATLKAQIDSVPDLRFEREIEGVLVYRID